MPHNKQIHSIDQISTLEPSHRTGRSPQHALGLTLLYHPDLSRVGERANLSETPPGMPIPISRLEPRLGRTGHGEGEPLATAFVSRKPFWCSLAAGKVVLTCEPGGTEVIVDGEPVCAPRELASQCLQTGVVLELQGRVVLLLHWIDPLLQSVPTLGFVGSSDALQRLRHQLVQVAELTCPVLLRGETGTGKELAAQALHQLSGRRSKPFVEVNLAAVPTSTAASLLFGHVRGAFTGATSNHPGFFEQADGGTLFLDEVGITSPELQAMLLRALETEKIQPVGATSSKRVDVRVIAATDESLEVAMGTGRFRAPLFHRLAGTTLTVPPLRDRRGDIAELFFHFLRQELERAGALHRLAPETDREPLWLPTELFRKLIRLSWPGNVRQLQNVVRHLVLAYHQQPMIDADQAWQQIAMLPSSAECSERPHPVETAACAPFEAAAGINEEQLIAALRANRHRIGATAKALGIARNTLYALMERSEKIRKAKDIPPDEVWACQEEHHGDLEAAAEKLGVSLHALKLRLKNLGRR